MADLTYTEDFKKQFFFIKNFEVEKSSILDA